MCGQCALWVSSPVWTAAAGRVERARKGKRERAGESECMRYVTDALVAACVAVHTARTTREFILHRKIANFKRLNFKFVFWHSIRFSQ